ncbi:helix-turn-helix domain-containing protein [Leuconostoc mesenteroides]|uniref:helix-turn-helix domain-containing protein n=1 Tax=Leuconostoc mesenteroides TaxID=1245 RepID=UPI0022E5CAD4|nr:helix-turn-helix domain-containing protein [Leuconostoc mesenteroides]
MTSLSSQERTVIQTLLELNYSVRAIARFIKRSPSTVSIEIHQVTPYKVIPKERKIETVSAKELDQINHWINARPMKTLNWQSPRKVFQQFFNSCNLP